MTSTQKRTLIPSSMPADTKQIKELVKQLQAHKLMTESGHPVTFEIRGGILNVWEEMPKQDAPGPAPTPVNEVHDVFGTPAAEKKGGKLFSDPYDVLKRPARQK
jgi:hypothetical protein